MQTITTAFQSKSGTSVRYGIGTWAVPITIEKVFVYVYQKPDSGNLDIGWDYVDPDEVVDNFSLNSLTNNVPQQLSIVDSFVPAGTALDLKIGACTHTPGVGGVITIHYHR